MDLEENRLNLCPSCSQLVNILQSCKQYVLYVVQPSSRTQRLINGEPAKVDDPIILVGANESYEPRCRAHHIVAPSENEKEEM